MLGLVMRLITNNARRELLFFSRVETEEKKMPGKEGERFLSRATTSLLLFLCLRRNIVPRGSAFCKTLFRTSLGGLDKKARATPCAKYSE